MDELNLFASVIGDLGDGNFREGIFYHSRGPEESAKVTRCLHAMVDRALEMEGTCSGEHGVRLGRKASLRKELGPETIDVMRGIKVALDPKWLMNPGKIFDHPALVQTCNEVEARIPIGGTQNVENFKKQEIVLFELQICLFFCSLKH